MTTIDDDNKEAVLAACEQASLGEVLRTIYGYCMTMATHSSLTGRERQNYRTAAAKLWRHALYADGKDL